MRILKSALCMLQLLLRINYSLQHLQRKMIGQIGIRARVRVKNAKKEAALPGWRFDSAISRMADPAVRMENACRVVVPVAAGKSSEAASVKLPSLPSPSGRLERRSRTTSSGNVRLAGLLPPKFSDRQNL